MLELDRLDATDTEAMVRACLDVASVPEELSARLWTWTEGVPFLVEELLTAWIGSGALRALPSGWSIQTPVDAVVPASFADDVRRRMDALGTDARRVISAAAALGRSFDWTLLPVVSDLDERTVLAALRRSVACQLLAAEPAEGGHFGFRHTLTRDAVLRDLLPPERVEVFARALNAVEEAHPELPGAWCELAVELAQSAGFWERAAHLLLLSGRRALDQGALATAEAALERARALAVADADATLAVDLDQTLAEVLLLAGKTHQAVDVGVRLLTRLRILPALDSSRRAAVHLGLARAFSHMGNCARPQSIWGTLVISPSRTGRWCCSRPSTPSAPTSLWVNPTSTTPVPWPMRLWTTRRRRACPR